MLTSVPDEALSERQSCEAMDDVSAYVRRLVGAVEPAIVFSSLACLCVPGFSDSCSVDIVEGGRVRYRIVAPRAGRAVSPSADPEVAELFEIRTTFDSALDGWTSYTGVMVHGWRAYCPTDEDEDRAARLVRHAIAVISEQRLADPMRPAFAPASSAFRRARGHR